MSGNKGFKNSAKSGASYIPRKLKTNQARREAGQYFNKGIKGMNDMKENFRKKG